MIDNVTPQSSAPDKLTIFCYENEIPPFVKSEMESLYQNCFSSTAAEHVDNSNTSTYVVYRDTSPTAIFLFQRQNARVRVLNATIKVAAEEISRFANYIFSQYESIKTISFQSIHADQVALSFPYQKFNASEDIVLRLPNTIQAYLDSLGKSTRKYIKYHLNRPKRHFPNYCYKVHENDEIDEQLIQDIIDLNTARMDRKNRLSTIDEKQRKWIIKIAKTYGFVGVATINGRVCAGVICSRVGGHYFMHVISHDPHYDDYRLGTICCYLTICEAIARGGEEYHFLWGQGEYKYRLLGVQRDLHNLTVYRSRAQYYLNLDLVLKNAVASHIRKWKVRYEKNASANTLAFRVTTKFLGYLHKLQRLRH